MLRLCTAILAIGALYFARSIFAPVACLLFIIAIVWPFQRASLARMPRLIAVTITVFATLVVVTVLASMIVWGFTALGGMEFATAWGVIAFASTQHTSLPPAWASGGPR